MNLNLPAVVMLTAGVVLMYAAVKNKDPRDVVRESLGKKSQHGSLDGKGSAFGKAAGGAIAGAVPLLPPPPAGHGPVVSV